MTRYLRPAAGLVAAFASVAVLTACGGDNSSDNSASGGASTTAGGGGGGGAAKTGGDFKIYGTSFPDFLDPALSYTVDGWQVLWTVYTGLLTYNHSEGAEGSKLIPGLAEAMPDVSSDGKTYTLTLRKGLKFSDGQPVKASDFETTIKRVLNLESGGSAFYLGITGAEEYVKAGKAKGDISGITTDDATGKITIKLKKADGSFPFYLAMDFAGLVPSNTPFENQTKSPPPGVGPFKFTKVKQPRGWTVVKNENFPKIPGIEPARVDSITSTIVKNQRRQVQDVLQNKVDYIIDPPPADQIRTVKSQAADRYKEFVTNSTYYYFLNTREAPFDKKEVRQAVNYAVDKTALARIFGGLLEPGCNFLPPGMQGYQKIDPCPYGDPKQKPSAQNIQKAKDLIKQAGAQGASVTVYGNDEEPSKPSIEYLADVLNSIGLKAKPRIVEGSVYFTTIGNQKTKAQAGFANWFQDYPAPSNFMFLINGKSIQETNNQNYGNVDDPEINKLIDGANPNPDLASVADQYAKADRLAVENAYLVPYGHRKLTTLVSNRVNFESCTPTHPVYNLDLTKVCLK